MCVERRKERIAETDPCLGYNEILQVKSSLKKDVKFRLNYLRVLLNNIRQLFNQTCRVDCTSRVVG